MGMTQEQLEEMLKRIQADNVTLIGNVAKSMMEEVGKTKESSQSLVDTRGIGTPLDTRVSKKSIQNGWLRYSRT